MAWDWLKDNNDEPNEFKPIDARGLLDGKEYHDYWTTKLHNGLANVPKSLLGAVESIPAMAARTRPVVMQELENDLDGTGLMDSDADKEALSTIESQTTAPIWEGARLGIKAAKDALPDANWESNVDESQLSYPKKIGGMIVENAPLMALQLAASAANPALGVALVAGSTAGDTYNDLTEKGVDPLAAGQAAWINAAAQAPLEGVGEMGWLKAFRELGTEGAAKLMGKAFVKEGLTEAVQEFPDETIPYIAEHGSLDGFDWGQLASNAVDAGVVGGIYGGGFAGIGRAINGKAQPDEAQADNGDAPSPSPAIHAMNRLVNELGIDPKAASGIVGGLMLESGGNTTDISTTAENPESGAYGIGQWTGSRKAELMAFAEETGGDPNDLDTQISFLIHELKGSENGALQEILKAQSPDEAGRLADQFYERSEGTDKIRNQKATNAQTIYDIFMNGGADSNVVYSGGKRGGSSVPNPKSAEDFLKDLEETLPADTDEDVEKLNAIRKSIQGKNKKAQEELAAQYGWGENAPETAQDASEGVAQENVQAGNSGASEPVNSSSSVGDISKKPEQSTVTATPTVEEKPQAGNGEENKLSNVRTGSPRNEDANLPVAPGTQTSTGAKPPVAPSMQSTPLPASPTLRLPPANATAVKKENNAQVPQAKIEKARSNQKLKELVKQAFVDGDKDALSRLGAMQINPDILEAVKNDVLSAHQSPLTLPSATVPAKGTTLGTAAPIAPPPVKATAPTTATVAAGKPTSTNTEGESVPVTDSNANSNISEKENNHENTEKNQPVHHSEENKNDNAKPEQSKPSESKDRKTSEGKNPVKNAPSKETPSSEKKEAQPKAEQPKAEEMPQNGKPTKPEVQDTESATSKEKEPSVPKETVFGSVEDADKDLEAAFGLKPVSNTEQEAKKAKPSKEEIHRKHKLVDDSDEAIQGYIDEFISKTRNLNAGFDPTILVPVFKICAAYTQRGITKFADFASKTIAAFKSKGVKQKDIEPWLAPAWEAVKSFPDTDKKFDAKKLVVALKAVGARYESGLETADAVKDDIRSKYGDKAVSTLNDYIDAAFRGVQAYFNKGKNTEPAKKSEPSNVADRSGTDIIDYAFNQGGIIRKDVIQNMSPEDVDTVSKIFDGGDKSVDSPQENDTIEESNSNVVSTKEDKDVRGRKSGSGRPVEVGGSRKSGTGGKGEQRTTRGNSETPDRDGGRERGPDVESAEPKNKGTGEGRELGRGQAEDGTRMERANGEGTSAGGTKKPVISPKADKVETDIAKGKVKDARGVPGNDYIAKPVPPDAKGASKTQRVDNNIAAIKLLKKIESENRMATPAEQEILAGYSGWGGLGSEMKSDAKRMAQLKELLTEEEYNAAERELLTAFYTPPFVIGRMWELAEHLGFKGGRVLDPSCGVGSFFSLMPASLRERSTALQGVELSPIPARIAKQLYQSKKFKIDNQDYTKFDRGNGFYDLAITNVPFSNSVKASVPAMRDSDGGVHKSLLIHDYYFAQTLDKVRPGGLIVFMTSSGTMDRKAGYDNALLRHLSSRAKLVGIVRLPNTLFAPSANVGTDIVVFRKLNEGENPDTVDATNGWTNGLTTIEAKDDEGRHTYTRINGYYEDNPDNIIGDPVLVRDRYGSRNVEFHTSSNAETDKKLGEAIARLPENVYVPREPVKINTPSHVKELVEAEDGQNVDDIVKGKDGQWGRVVVDDNGELKLKLFAKSAQAKVGAFKELGNSLNEVLEKQVDAEVSEEELAAARDKLNKQYDNFVKKYGHVNDLSNARLFAGSPTAGRVLALEYKYKAGKKGQKSTAEKAPILTKRTAYPTTDDINISTISDALASSLRKFGYVDTKYMANALGKSEDSVVRELGDRLFKDPVSEQYVTRDEYLSGNVRQKLAFAEDAARTDPEYERNVTELKAVIPKDIGISDISIELGSPILSVEDTQAFVDHLAGQADAIELRYNPVTSIWDVKKGVRYYTIPYQREVTMYGIEAVTRDDDDIKIVDVIRAMLNGGVLGERGMFNAKDSDTEEVRKARSQAAAKVPILFKKINQELKEWIVSNSDVKNRVETSYNNRFNATVPRVYDGSLLTFPWIETTSPIRPRVHQANAVWRTINEKSVLYAHCVGSGKTLTMQAAGMELKKMGLANKIVYTVPKNVVKQFEEDFYKICPTANLLVLDSTTLPDDVKSVEFDVKPVMVKNDRGKLVQEKDADGIPVFKKVPVSKEEAEKRRVLVAKRNATLNKILTHDWDGIIMSHQTFERLPLSDDYIEKFLNEQIAQYRRALEAEQIANGGRGKKSRSLKDIQDALSKLEGKLKELIANKEARDFASPSFESLGIDQIFVDEADLFKNLQTQTKLGQVKGVSTSASGRSFDMFMKSQYLLHSPSAHGVVFATGTPISNSVTELYTMCRYLANDELAKLGIDSFDQFAKTFIDIGQGEVPKQDGSGYEYKNMVLGLKNAPECLKIFRSFADVQMAQDLPEITKKRPTAHRITTVVKETAWIRRFKKEIRARAAAIRSSSRREPPMINSRSKKSKEQFAKTGEYIQVADSPLVLANDFKTATLAPFLIDSSLTGEEGYGKVWKCADNVYSEWKNSAGRRGAQLVFCDLSTPTSDGTPNVYDALKSRLMELGIPESDIAFVQDAKTDAARQELFTKVDNGEIRILIGSTTKMGAGTNMQHKLVALHHLDCPWRPRDIEQREGRIIRQGNENNDVNIYNYVAEGTYDANLWDLVRSKADTIAQIMRGDTSTRDADTEVVDSNNFEQLAELANADPDQKRYLQVGKELRELEAAKSAFDKSQETAKLILSSYPEQVEAGKAAIKNVEADIETVSKTSASDFSITIGESNYSNRNEANEAFVKEKERIAKEYAKILYRYKGADPKLKDTKVGMIRGLDIYVSGNNPYFKASKESASLTVYIKGKEAYGVATPSAVGVWNSAQTQPPAKLKGLTASVKQKEADIEEARKAQNATFDGDAKIATLQKEYEELRTRIDKKAQQQRERDNARPVEIELYERDPFSDYDFDSDDPDVYTINMNIVEGLKESMRESGADTGTVSFDKPGSWDKFKKKFIDKTNWAVYSNENTIEITASKKDLNDLYEAIESPNNGKSATVRTDDGKELEVSYRIVPAETLIASNTADFGKNENYPEKLQPRDRDRVSMKEQVDDMARNLRPEDLAESRSVNQGAPLVNQDNVVENGNGRTMAITRAYTTDGDAYKASSQKYKQYLVKHAEEYGYTREEVEAMQNPVLIRQRDASSDSLQDSIIHSTEGGMKMSASQQAKVDAEKISPKTLSLYDYDGTGDLTKRSNDDFVVSALNEITDKSDRDVVFNKDGTPSKAGIERVKSALAAYAYGDNSLLEKISESTDTEDQNIVKAFSAAAPRVAAIKAKLDKGGTSKDYDLSSLLSDVLDFYFKCKNSGKSIKFALNETNLFGDDSWLASVGGKNLARFIADNTRRPKAISDAIVRMTKYIDGANEPSDALFSGTKMRLDEIVRTSIGLNASKFIPASKPNARKYKHTIQPKENTWDSMPATQQKACIKLMDANGGHYDAKTKSFGFTDEKARDAALNVLEAYLSADSKASVKIAIIPTANAEVIPNSRMKSMRLARRKPDRISIHGKTDTLLTGRGWNGSPADFDHFDLAFIGTGEGHAAHGWGIYFARDVTYKGDADWGRKVSEGYKKRYGGADGKLYYAAIPSDNYLLDEQIPLKDQPKHVQESVRRALSYMENLPEDSITEKSMRTIVGRELYGNHAAQASVYKLMHEFLADRPKSSGKWNPSPADLKSAREALDHYSVYTRAADIENSGTPSLNTLEDVEQYIDKLDKEPSQESYEIATRDVLFDMFEAAMDQIKAFSAIPHPEKAKAYNKLLAIQAGADARPLVKHMLDTIDLSDGTDRANLERAFYRYIFDPSTQNISAVEKIISSVLFKDASKNRALTKGDIDELNNITNDLVSEFEYGANKLSTITQDGILALTGHDVQQLLYEAVAGSGNRQKDVAKILKEAGLKGYKYDGGMDGPCAVVFDNDAMKIINKFSVKTPYQKMVENITPIASDDLTAREKAIVDFAKKMGLQVQFFEGDPNLHGFHADGTNVAFLNRRSAMDLNQTFWHEAFHWMRESNPDLYNQMVKEVFGGEVSEKQLADYAVSIGRTDMSKELAIEEMLADAMWDAGKRGSFFEKLGIEHPSLCAKIIKWIKNLYEDFKAHFHNPQAGLTNTQIKRMSNTLSKIAEKLVDGDGNKLFSVDEKGNIKETAAGKRAVSDRAKVEAERDGSNQKYRVTNKALSGNDQMQVTELTGDIKDERLGERVARVCKMLEGCSFAVSKDGIQLYFKSNKDLDHFAAGNKGKRNKEARLYTISSEENVKNVIENSVYVEEERNIHNPNSKTHFVQFYSVVKSGNNFIRMKISAKKLVDGTFDVQKASLYNIATAGSILHKKIKKLTQPAMNESMDNLRPRVSSLTVSVADMLDGVNDRGGNPYVVNGKLQHENGVIATKNMLSSGPVTHRSAEDLKAQTLSVFPNAQNIETHDNGVSFDLPNGSHVEVNFTDDTISVDRAKAQKDYGGTLQGNEKASGKIEMVDKDALITLTMDSPDETISHEAMHLAWNLLTDRERNALLRTYGSEEGAAEGMREWKIRRKMKQGTIAGKIMQKISDMAHKLLSLFHENDQHVFQKLESGEMWERSNGNNTAARNVKYKMNPLNEAEKYLKSHKDFGEKAGVYIDRTFRPDLAKAKANPNISVNKTAKKKGWGVANTALNNTVRSPSRIKSPKTNYIWGLADTAQRELQELRGRWTHNFAGAIKNLNKEEKARYTDILWEEDMKQHVFSDEELRDAGVSENVIKAHQKTRNLLGKIYNAVNAVYTSERVENFTYKTRKGAEKAQKELAKRPHTFVMHDIRETTKDGEPVFQVSIKTRGYKEIHSVVTSEELSALSKDKDVYIKAREQMDDGSFKVSYLAYNKPLTNMEGYMPHIFHGVLIMKKYTDADGNVKSKVVGSADTIEKAVVKADAMQKEEGGEFIIAPKEFSSEGEVENPLLLGDMDYFKLMENLSKGASLTLDEAREMTHATMKGRHVYYGAKRHRKGAEGFEKNAIWAIQHHIDSSSRYVALDPFKQKAISFFERAFGDYNKDWTGEAAFCKGYIDSVLGKPSRLETLANDFLRLFPWFKNEARPARRMAGNLTGLTGVLKLGASLSSGFVNTLQLFNCVGYVGARKTAVGLKRALHPNAADKKILVASGVSEESGLALDSIGHITAEGTALSKAGNVINSVNNFLMKPFTLAEKTIRKATILAAYYKAIEDGLSKGEAIQYARDINRKVNFDYSVADAPRIFRALQGTVIGDMALQFQKYGVKEMEVISDFLPILGNTTTKQKLEFFIPYLLVSGIWNAFPFEDALLSLLKLFGFDDPEKEAKRAMMEWAGNNPDRKALVNVANYGAGAIVGVDISQRVGLKGVVPETSNIVTGGPLGSTTIQLAKAVLNGDANGAMKAVSPALGNVYGAVAGYNTDSKGRKTVDYDTKDRIVRGVLGFRTIREANATDAQNIVYNYKEQKKNDRAKAKSEYLKDPSSSNRQKLKEMGYSDKEIKALKDDKKSTRVERSQSGLSKEDKKKLKPVFDYVQ